jgi:hypothetical protein
MHVSIAVWKYGATPPEVADLAADILQGKKMFFIGCADSEFMMACKKYVKSISCMDIKESDYVERARAAGFDVMIADPLTAAIPDADIYFIWIGSGKVERQVANRLAGKTILFGDKHTEQFVYLKDVRPNYRAMLCVRENDTILTPYKLAIINSMPAPKGG